MTVAEGFIPLLLLLGALAVAAPWLDPESNVVRHAWFWLSTIIAVRYLIWRVVATLPPPELSVRYAYQLFSLLLELIFYYLVLKIRLRGLRRTNRTPEADRHQGWWKEKGPPPLVDVFIPTYNEAKEILERTVVGASRLDYPRYRIWILDDGRRRWLSDWAKERGLNYLTRAKNTHYKAGNMNAALEHVLSLEEPPDFIAVVDADFIVRPRFLRRTVALMYDEATAVVQTPQVFFNPDPFQHSVMSRAAWPDEQRQFFDYTLPNQDYNGRATCSGTSFLVRVSALRKIDGFPTESVSEDTLMSIKFMERGMRTVYLDEQLSSGLNPDGMREFLTQRARWSLGLVEIAQSAWGPLANGRGLRHWRNWIDFTAMVWTWPFFCIYGTLTALMSIVFWLTGVYSMQPDVGELVFYAAPLWFEGFILAWLTRGRYLPMVREAMEVVTGFAVLPATLKAVRKSGGGFAVTPKGVQRDAVVVHWRMLVWLLPLLLLQVFGVVLTMTTSHMADHPLYEVGLFDAAKTVLMLTFAILPCIELPKYRKDERYTTTESGRLEFSDTTEPVQLLDLSAGGAGLELERELEVGAVCRVWLTDVGWIRARVVRRVERGCYGLAFELTAEQRDELIFKIYCSDDYVKVPERWSLWTCLSAMGRRVFWGRRKVSLFG